MIKKTIDNTGFSLIEILVSIAVAAVVFPAVISLLGLSAFTSSQGETYTKAYTLAQKDMESVYIAKKDWSNFYTAASTGSLDSLVTTPTIGFTETITPTIIDPDEIKVEVKVVWNERGIEQLLIVESIVSNI